MHTVRTRTTFPLRIVAAALLALTALTASVATADGAARPGGRAGQIVFVAGKAKQCRMGACPAYDLVQSIAPRGGHGRVLAKVRSAVETAATEDGTVAVLSKIVAGGGANSDAYTQIYLIGPDGKRREVFRDRLQGFAATGLGISGDGRLLALSGRRTAGGSGQSKIWLVRSNGTGLRQLTGGPGMDETPAISPDGERVVFARTTGGDTQAARRSELYAVGTDGGEPVRLTENGVEDVNPVFSPDGTGIAFGQVTPRNRGTVHTIRADGSGPRKVTSTGREYPDPDYSPSGRSIAFVGEVPGARGGYASAIYTVRASGSGRSLASGAFDAPGLPQWTRRR